jgi:2-oxoglutarate dehydrogenase E1 component
MDELSDNDNKGMAAQWRSSLLAGGNAPYLEELYERYLRDPASVETGWRAYFDGLPRVNGAQDVSHSLILDSFRQQALHAPRAPMVAGSGNVELALKQVRVLQLINAYRFRGHQRAAVDPLEPEKTTSVPDLNLDHHGLSAADLDSVFDTGSLVGPKKATLREILDILTRTYSSHLGAEYMYITDTAEKRWLQQRLEGPRGYPQYPPETKRRLLHRVTAAEGLERYLHAKYVGQKRFSLEGGESLIPLLDGLVQRAGSHGLKELVIGMAHRGRLNVLVNILGKLPKELFQEFEGKAEQRGDGSGDVKYHMGFSTDIQTGGGPVHVALAFNPSHLEIVGPVVEGSVRARQERLNDSEGGQVMAISIHGDAAFAGQGVVMETLNMSQSRGYSTKGTVHIVINNQIGFTTSYQQDARSSLYCTDVAKMVDAPIFHVNGDDPEAVQFVSEIALDYRMAFRKDVVIDLVCYRRHGHSEADEPSVTQPQMYRAIREKPTTRTLYARLLVEQGVIDAQGVDAMLADFNQAMDAGESVAPDLIPRDQVHYAHASDWRPYLARDCTAAIDTGVPAETLRDLSQRLQQLPEGFDPHPAVKTILTNRSKMAAGALPIDWGYAEIMAYASLIHQGYGVRLSGQDSGRGTFFHRHAVLVNQKDGESYIPLRHLAPDQANFLVINSLLSEEAVLAFEYGYATTEPRTLTLWEAQFGDFANGAQVVIDQFISAGEQKWERLCGLVLLLPHGYEGQGPEHSSARIERYLQLCAEQNMWVCMPTTPAQIFHLLRRQMLRACRKPMIVFAPKSLLRHRLATSSLEEMTQGQYQTILPEIDPLDDNQVTRVVLCSGKVYYDLLEQRRQEGRSDVAILRMEQLYPFPKDLLKQELKRYPNVQTYVWCQDEPKNQGAWYTSQHHVHAILSDLGWQGRLAYAGRPLSAAPAVGYPWLHIKQLRELIATALGSPA